MAGKDPQETKDAKNPYALPAKGNAPPEPPLWKGHAWQPVNVDYDWGSGTFSDGYVPGPGDKPRF